MAVATQEEKLARKWRLEITLSSKREKDFRDKGENIVKRYRGDEKKRNRYNILWATTETLRPAIYNSKPQPDVRRRFRDSDPLGKAVSETLERALYVLFDSDEPDRALKNDLLDALLCGRGVSVVRYVPKIGKASPDEIQPPQGSEEGARDIEGVGTSEPAEPDEEGLEQVEDEQVTIEHVDWRDYREGFGRTLEEVPWKAFRHKLTRKDATEKFGKEAIADVKFEQENNSDAKKPTDQYGETAKVAEFWEVWDKLGEKVFFVHEECESLLFPLDNPDGEPPIDFPGFFPCPDALMLVENTGSRIPVAPFHLYEEQANELDKVSTRIDRIVGICRLRGIYDSRLAEVPDLLAGDDNELTPIQNAQVWTDKGLDAAIAWLPVEQVEKVLAALYNAREQQKRIIDELTGVSDIVRGATDPNETAAAQELKGSYHSIRLSRMQRELQRYAKDLMRLAAAVMATKFSAQTFAQMTDLKFPTAEQKQLMQAKLQQSQQPQMPLPGQPPVPPQPPDPNLLAALQVPSWEDILGLMHSSALRQFRVDVETDSTVANMLQSDMQGLSQVLQAVAQTLTELAPLVVQGALPPDAAKELVMAVIRRAKMGSAVEDAFDKMQAPKPQPNPAQVKAQADVAKTQAQAEADAKSDAARAQADIAVEHIKQQGEQQLQAMRESAENQRKAFVEYQESMRENFRVQLEGAVKILVAQINATKATDPEAGPIAERDFSRQQ